jgi:hypothetical protein
VAVTRAKLDDVMLSDDGLSVPNVDCADRGVTGTSKHMALDPIEGKHESFFIGSPGAAQWAGCAWFGRSC